MSETFEQLDPNYVIAFEYSKDNLTYLVTELTAKGLNVLTRPGYDSNTSYAYTRVEDHGFQGNFKVEKSIEVTEQSGNEILFRICGPLNFVKSISPIYDLESRHKLKTFADTLIKKSLYLPSHNDLLKLSELTKNPKESLYFAFFRTYIRWLGPISLIGIVTRLLSRGTSAAEFNVQYTLCLLVWSVLFMCSWVFQYESQFNSKLGKINGCFSYTDKKLGSPVSVLIKKLCFIPIAILFAITLISYQLFCFSIEIFIGQFYEGALKPIFSFIPLVLLTVFVPFITNLYNKIFVDRLVGWENGPNPNKSKVEKNFVLTFLTSYMPLLITLFFYLPMGYKLTPEWKDVIVTYSARYHIPVQTTDFIIDVNRYRNQFFYFTVTNHIVVMAMEDIVPYLMDRLLPLIQKDPKRDTQKDKLTSIMKANYSNELELWHKINNFQKTAYGEFNVDENYRKLIVQFGYITMFSTIWPLAPFCCLCFNYVIFKIDLWRALQKCKPSSNVNNIQVPVNSFTAVTVTAEPWNTVLETITWLGALISPCLVIMYRYCALPGVGLKSVLEKRDTWYRHSPLTISRTRMLLVAIISEHIALLTFFYLKKVFNASREKFVYGFVPAVEYQEPPKINLNEMIKKTVSLMDMVATKQSSPISDQTASIHNASKSNYEKVNLNNEISELKEKSQDKVNTGAISTDNSDKDEKVSQIISNSEKLDNGAALPKEEVHVAPESAYQAGSTSLSKKNVQHEQNVVENPEGNDVEASKTNESSCDSLSAAGATLPETIPTSKNYHLRYDKDGNPIKSPNATAESQSSVVADIPDVKTKQPEEDSGLSASKTENIEHNAKSKGKFVVNHIKNTDVENGTKTKEDNILTTKEQQLAVNAAANALGNHSRTSSHVNAVQQFVRDVPNSMTSSKSHSDHLHTPTKVPTSPKSKNSSVAEHNGSTLPRKKSSASKRSSFDAGSGRTKEHKKHKGGLLHKLKKKL